MEGIASFKWWICLAGMAGVLGAVTALAIHAKPSASSAMAAIRIAHLELFWAKIAFRDPAVQEAELHLKDGWSALRDGRYEQSVFAASQALQRVRDIKGGVPSLYISHSRRAGETATSAETLTRLVNVEKSQSDQR